MTKELFALHIADTSAFARSLGQALSARHADRPKPPGQVELLNLIARTQGQRNWQALRQSLRQSPQPSPRQSPTQPPAPALPNAAAPAQRATASTTPLSDNARKALGQFDGEGQLIRWPVKFSVQRLVMWVLWTHFDGKRAYTEREVNAILKAAHRFADHATLRRELINHQLMARKSDCSEYRKLPARPDEETRALLGAWRARFRAAG